MTMVQKASDDASPFSVRFLIRLLPASTRRCDQEQIQQVAQLRRHWSVCPCGLYGSYRATTGKGLAGANHTLGFFARHLYAARQKFRIASCSYSLVVQLRFDVALSTTVDLRNQNLER